MFFDPFGPLDVGENLVDRKTEKFGVHGAEFVVILLERDELGGTNRGEICWVTKKHKPFSGIIGWKGFWTMSGLDLHGW